MYGRATSSSRAAATVKATAASRPGGLYLLKGVCEPGRVNGFFLPRRQLAGFLAYFCGLELPFRSRRGPVVLIHSKICKGCWQQLHLPVPLRGPASLPFRVFGVRPSRMNPNTCTFCELMFSKIMRASKITIDATILFADMRGYTSFSRQFSFEQMSPLLDDFYDECATAIWEHDGLLNKTMGDAVMAVFNFPIKQEDHTFQAVRAAHKIRERWRVKRASFAERLGLAAGDLAVGIGIDCGEISFGEFGRSHLDLTAIGNVVNMASRAQSVALGNEILVTQSVRGRLSELAGSPSQQYQLKGFDSPSTLFAA